MTTRRKFTSVPDDIVERIDVNSLGAWLDAAGATVACRDEVPVVVERLGFRRGTETHKRICESVERIIADAARIGPLQCRSQRDVCARLGEIEELCSRLLRALQRVDQPIRELLEMQMGMTIDVGTPSRAARPGTYPRRRRRCRFRHRLGAVAQHLDDLRKCARAARCNRLRDSPILGHVYRRRGRPADLRRLWVIARCVYMLSSATGRVATQPSWDPNCSRYRGNAVNFCDAVLRLAGLQGEQETSGQLVRTVIRRVQRARAPAAARES